MFFSRLYIIALLSIISVSNTLNAQQLIPYRSGNKWGFTNKNQEVIIKPKFDKVGFFYSDATWVLKNGTYFIIDNKGHKTHCKKYKTAKNFGAKEFIVSQKNTSEFCIDKKGNKIRCNYICEETNSIESHFHLYRKNNKVGILYYKTRLDSTGNKTVYTEKSKALWNDFKENNNGQAAVKKDSLWGIIDKTENLISPYIYNDIKIQNRSYYKDFMVQKNTLWGFVNSEGKEFIKTKYYKVDFFENNGLARVFLNETFWFYVDREGNEYYKK